MKSSDETDLALMRQIEAQQANSQRELAENLGLSVGKINFCLRALVDKGWIKANNFRRADNKWAYCYLLTPAGVKAKLRMTRAFLSRKEREFELLQAEITRLREELDQANPP